MRLALATLGFLGTAHAGRIAVLPLEKGAGSTEFDGLGLAPARCASPSSPGASPLPGEGAPPRARIPPGRPDILG